MRKGSAFISGMATSGILATGVFIGTGMQINQGNANQVSTSTNSSNPANTNPNGNNQGASTNQVAAGSNSQSSSGAADGVYDGQVVQTPYGPMQIEITIAQGKITQATALQHPGGDRNSDSINSQVIPILVKATVDYQSVNFGNVSRATISTNAYKQSAQSALDQAGFTG